MGDDVYTLSEDLRLLRSKYTDALKQKLELNAQCEAQRLQLENLQEEDEKRKQLLDIALLDIEVAHKKNSEYELKLQQTSSSSSSSSSAAGLDQNTQLRIVRDTRANSFDEGNESASRRPSFSTNEQSIKELEAKMATMTKSFETLLSAKDIELSMTSTEVIDPTLKSYFIHAILIRIL